MHIKFLDLLSRQGGGGKKNRKGSGEIKEVKQGQLMI
jgi:hypothetical protein